MAKPKLSLRLAILIIFALLVGSVSLAGEATIKPENLPTYSPKFYPFERGEKELYRATWNGMFSVATAEVTTTSSIVDGKKVYLVRVDAKTSKALDLIWKMRDVISATFDAKSLAPSHYHFRQRENSRVIDTEAKLDANSKRWAVNRQQNGKTTRVYEFDSQNTFDPVTAVYLARSIDFKVGDKLYFKVFGGRYQYLLELFVEKKRTGGASLGQDRRSLQDRAAGAESKEERLRQQINRGGGLDLDRRAALAGKAQQQDRLRQCAARSDGR